MIEIKKIEFKVNLNITEDLNKIKHCLVNLLPDESLLEQLKINEVSGIYGNPIKILNLKIQDNINVHGILNIIGEKIQTKDKKKIYREFYKRLGEKKNLHLRLKKSQLYNNEFMLYDHSDVVRITLYFIEAEMRSPKKIDPLDLREYLIISNIILKDESF